MRQLNDLLSDIDLSQIRHRRDHRGATWTSSEIKVGFLAVPKCASCAVRHAFDIPQARVTDVSLVPKDFQLFTIVREPVERFISAYLAVMEPARDYPGGRFQHDLELSPDEISTLCELQARTDQIARFRAYFRLIKHDWGFFELHCTPQVIYLTDKNNQPFENVDVYRMDEIPLIEERFGVKIPKANSSPNKKLKFFLRENIQPRMRAEIAELYEQDVEMYRRV